MELLYQQFCRKTETLSTMFRHKHFENAMKHLYWQMDRVLDQEKTILYIDYFMDCIKRDLQASQRTYEIYHGNLSDFEPNRILPERYFDGQHHFSTEDLVEKHTALCTEKVVLIPRPWKSSKLYNLLPKIQKEGFHQGKQTMKYFRQLGIATIGNGNHSLSVEVYMNQVNLLQARIYDISPMFSHVECCGTHWFDRRTQDTLGEMTDFRIALLYEAAKLKFELEQ